VDRGFSQKEGIYYEEIFYPVARYTSIRTIIALATKNEVEVTPDGCENNLIKWCY
jgi:hypothetical protein